mmetsp:Transcript_100471/g.174382  ORF Transcript_100471/g.174382 Transcript_100471/m.174382 type:complete len:224 (+) Transcript_100471:97-768(+)
MFGALPVQVGPASDYARSKKKVLFTVLCAQAVLGILRLVQIDILGALFNIGEAFLGYYAYREDMNITLIIVYGLVCIVTAVHDTIVAIIPMILDILTLAILTIIWKCITPVISYAGAYLAYLIYADYNRQHGDPHGAAGGGIFDPFGTHPKQDDPFLGGVAGGGFFGSGEQKPFFSPQQGQAPFSGEGFFLGGKQQQAQPGIFGFADAPGTPDQRQKGPFQCC